MARVRTIAILGTRGIPARYGGFETAAETIAVGLRKAGFDIIASCETNNSPKPRPETFQGIKLVYFPVKNALRPLSEIIYDVRSLIVLGTKVDALYMLGYGAGLFFWIPRLVLARMEPDNNVDKIIRGFSLTRTTRKLLLVGPCISQEYLSQLKILASKDPRIILAGPLYELGVKNMLRWHCAAYVHGHMVGGTNPSLLEALGSGNVVIGTDVEFNREVIGNGTELPAFYFRPDPVSIADAIDLADPDLMRLRQMARVWGPARIKERYDWTDIIRGYETLFKSL